MQNRHLVNVFREAKAAYQERKAEFTASRQRGPDGNARSQERLKYASDDHRHHHHQRSLPPSPSRSQSHHHHHQDTRPSLDRHRSGGSTRSGPTSPRSDRPSSHRSRSHESSSAAFPAPGIQRSYTADSVDKLALSHRKPVPTRSVTSPDLSDIDMGLAYGDLPPSSPPLSRSANAGQQDLKPLVSKVSRLLEEADCLRHSASATIDSLQKRPEAMAAIALTLAEISNLVRKMAPGAIFALKNSAPTVFALLASPEFLIAGGLAVGLTVVAFGGYKIVKKLKASEGYAKEPSMDEMIEIGGDVKMIDNWRRGVAESEIQSDVTSVDEELITPQAHALSRMSLQDNSSHPRRHKSHSKAGSSSSSRSRSSAGSSRSSSSSGRKGDKKVKEKSVKRPSPLRLMFQ